ncbi:MAG TPA: rod shape-determining protein MreC [Polyangiaceae bacterium]|nr:rod shape-determining protein MreC [Polyangiaceae bacterium]
MSPTIKQARDVVIVVVLLAVPFFVLKANMKSPESQSTMNGYILRVSAPIEVAAAMIARGVGDVWDDYVYLVDVKQDNARLAYDNARLREQVHSLEQAEVESRQLRRLLQLKDSTPGDAVSAQVIGKDFTEFFRVTRIVLDKGARDVRSHMPVISPDGVVGAVLHVAGDTVDVQLAVDAAFGVDVEDERTRARGFVRGTGDPARYGCKVEMVDSRDDVEIGDLLVTSGKGRWFPRGIPVARVTKVIKRELGRDQDVDAAPTVDFSRLDNVLVLVTTPGDETTAPSTAGNQAPGGPRGRQ